MEETNEQRVRRLNEMDEQEVAYFCTELTAKLSAEEEYKLRHEEDYVMEMPQSGERIRGRENMRAFQEAFTDHSNLPTIRLRRVIVRENLWVGESVIDYGGQIFHGAAIIELREGKIWRDTRYFAEPFEAPEWRARWVERMESREPDATLARGERRNATDGREIERLIERQWMKVRAGDFAGAHENHADDCVVEWPQSGERIRGKKNLLALREAYPTGVEFEVRRIIVRPDLGVSEYIIRYGGEPVNVVAIVEFGDGEMVKETHYFAEPFPPPTWRARWVERMETG